MPDESCRKCGGALLKCTLCAECKEVVSLICDICGTRTSEQFHRNCMYQVERIQTEASLEIPLEIASQKQCLDAISS